MNLVLLLAMAVQAAPPNIVVIMMDDLGYGDVGSYGGADIRTPHIDRLAREGVKLTDFYANAANCSPTRTAFITGRYQQRYGIEMPLGHYAGDLERGLTPRSSRWAGCSRPVATRRRCSASGTWGGNRSSIPTGTDSTSSGAS